MIDFSSYGSGFPNSHTLSIFCLVPLSWRIYPHTGWVFPTHAPGVYFTLCLHSGRFLIMQVEFFWLIKPKNILPCVFTMWISLYIGQVFLTHMLWVYFASCFHHDWFLLIRIEFSQLTFHGHILPYASIIFVFSSCVSSFLDTWVSGIFCLVSPL